MNDIARQVDMSALSFTLERLDSPIGPMLLVTDDQQRLRALDWLDHESRMQTLLQRHYRHEVELREATGRSAPLLAVRAYFDGDITATDGLPVAMGGTEFQRKVWTALRDIPAGQTWSYRELATRIGQPKAVRAVGMANGANLISIVVPCHRVIGSDGSLTGYGGGLQRKQWLLEHERQALRGVL
ncbi:MAG TPA: methylated-DNA--[protein]-cysteine S-methyltransferase [Pseudomonadales bacterium]|nr:methylated-DNA--[protein]-cysteine S-methyltransferase [Pseudomonadales bacterium]HNC68896.1 methylated-DNA--[protein]-cysteine S-methyltransferase [Pseudomonadales bacterium]